MRKIIISNTNSIKKLEFEIPKNNGLYLLVGANGAGKTTLLVCLERICNSYAFARGFSATRNVNEIDQYENATIEYIADKINVKFRKKTAKWAPTPKKNSSELLAEFGFSDTIFIKADSKRIEVTQEEIRQGSYISAESRIIDALNEIFGTNKYGKLKRLKNANGRGKQSTYFYVIKDGRNYYSEKRFSTGEIALLRLIERIYKADENTLLLLDEGEMALHPRIQKNLLDFIDRVSKEMNIMIIISTHSTTMIKATSKNKILLLESDSKGNTKVITPCYPAKAIGSVDFEKNIIFDAIFFVEDEMARLVLKKMLNRYVALDNEQSTIMNCIIPVGGYEQTALLAKSTRKQLLGQSKVYAVLDDDVFTESIRSNRSFAELYENNKDFIFSLKCTPESWFIEQLEKEDNALADIIRDKFHCEIEYIVKDQRYKNCKSEKPRKLAKQKMDCILEILEECSGDNKNVILDIFVQSLMDCMLNDGIIKSIIAPMIKSYKV